MPNWRLKGGLIHRTASERNQHMFHTLLQSIAKSGQAQEVSLSEKGALWGWAVTNGTSQVTFCEGK
ncbi:hypothetical protein ACFL9T_10270 [Thermodesulfobacteriota bacterium]